MGHTPFHEDDEEQSLFRQAVADVRPLTQEKRAPEPKRPPPLPRQQEADERRVLQELLSIPEDAETGEELLFCRPGVQNGVLRRLRRGHYAVEGELDLHGKTAVEAAAAMGQFLQLCRGRGWRSVRIIHGKGLRSREQQPVLKAKVDAWLRHSNDVLAFCSARQEDGGTGAVYVLLRRIK